MANNSMNKLYACRRSINNLLFVIGLRTLDATSMLYRCFPYISIFTHVYFIFGIVRFMLLHLNNLLAVVSVGGILVCQVASIVKVVCLLIQRDELIELLKNSDKFFNSLKKNPRSAELLRDFPMFYNLLLILAISCSTIFANGVGPFIVRFIIAKINNIDKHHHSLPVHVSYPWLPRQDGVNFVIHWTHQAYTSFDSNVVTCLIQAMFSFVVFRMISELRLISLDLKHVDKSNDLESVIRRCTDKYITILKYSYDIQKIFGPIILQMFISNALKLCIYVFLLSQHLATSAFNLMYFAALLTAKMSESFVSAFAGSKLIAESENYKHAVYCIDWHGDKRLTNWVLVALNQRPMTLIACHYTVVSLNIIVSIVNTTISYYFLLQTLQDK